MDTKRRAVVISRSSIQAKPRAAKPRRTLALAPPGIRQSTRHPSVTLQWIKIHAADGFTLGRVLLAFFFLWIGLIEERAVPARDIWILVLAWSTDMVDGQISRTLRGGHSSWIGRNDVYIDMFVSAAVLVYLARTDLLPEWVAALYLLIWAVVFARYGFPALLAQTFQNPIYAFFVYKTVRAEPMVLVWLSLWAAAAFLLFHQRLFELLKNVIRAFRR